MHVLQLPSALMHVLLPSALMHVLQLPSALTNACASYHQLLSMHVLQLPSALTNACATVTISSYQCMCYSYHQLLSMHVLVTISSYQCMCYWAIQAGLLTPLTFARHRLSPMAAFTSSAYFFHNGRQWQWICEFYTANFKGIFGGPWSACVWQQAITCCLCYRMPQNAFSPRNHGLLASQKMMQRPFFPNLHPLSPEMFATATLVAFVLLCNSRFNFHCYTQREATPTQKLAQKWRCDLLQLFAQKITKGIHSCKPASLNRPRVTISSYQSMCYNYQT